MSENETNDQDMKVRASIALNKYVHLDRNSKVDEGTDTGDAWEILHDMANLLAELTDTAMPVEITRDDLYPTELASLVRINGGTDHLDEYTLYRNPGGSAAAVAPGCYEFLS